MQQKVALMNAITVVNRRPSLSLNRWPIMQAGNSIALCHRKFKNGLPSIRELFKSDVKYVTSQIALKRNNEKGRK
jgi:hypothetical protein